MTGNSRTFAFGTLEENSDTWLLIAGSRVLFLDLPFDPSAWEHKTVSVVGKMGIPPSTPGIVKLNVEKLFSHDDIARRAYEIDRSGREGSADVDWFRAERELPGLPVVR